MSRLSWPAFSRACTPWVLALMLLVSLVPAVSRAMGAAGAIPSESMEAGSSRAGWVEVCGAGGVRWVQLDPVTSAEQPGEDPGAPPLLQHLGDLNHCALCGLALDRCLPSDAAVFTVPAASRSVFSPEGLTFLLNWPHARPRATGPPFLS